MDKKFLLKGIFRRALNGIVSVGLLLSVLGTYPLVNVRASAAAQNGIEPVVISSITGNVLSNGEFVYGPNVGNFDIQAYLAANAPHLAMYAEDLYGRADYYSINPKVYLTLLEVHARLLSNPDPSRIEDPFNLASSGFILKLMRSPMSWFPPIICIFIHIQASKVFSLICPLLPPLTELHSLSLLKPTPGLMRSWLPWL